METNSVAEFLFTYLEQNLKTRGIPDRQSIPDTLDFFDSGVLDSLGFVQMVTALQQKFDAEIDISDASMEEVSTFTPFCQYVERAIQQSGNRA